MKIQVHHELARDKTLRHQTRPQAALNQQCHHFLSIRRRIHTHLSFPHTARVQLNIDRGAGARLRIVDVEFDDNIGNRTDFDTTKFDGCTPLQPFDRTAKIKHISQLFFEELPRTQHQDADNHQTYCPNHKTTNDCRIRLLHHLPLQLIRSDIIFPAGAIPCGSVPLRAP